MDRCANCHGTVGPFYSHNAGPWLCLYCAPPAVDDSQCPRCGYHGDACGCAD